jgi:putative spermidine/putrescine transport system ATP-binding protein
MDSDKLELRKVAKTYGTVRAVDDVTLSVAKGELVALLGPSGCGKTTTLRMVAGFVQPSAGDIFIGGRRVTDLPPYRRDTGMVFQSYALFPHLTVAQNIVFGLKRRGVARAAAAERVARMIALMKLDGLEGRLPAQLSGGQQQRVAVARALVISPEVVLLDEPFSNLDAQLRESTRLELRKIQKQLDLTTIFVTHDQSEAMAVADRVAVMNQGRIVQVDTPERIYSRPRNRFVASFVGHTNIFKARAMGAHPSGTLMRADGFEVVLPGHAEGEITMVLRPETVTLADPGEPAPNSVRGVVESVSFLGAIARVVLRTGHAPFIADISGTLASRFSPGTPVTASWSSASLWITED